MLQYVLPNDRLLVTFILKGDADIIISTKERIKKEALLLFTQKGYYGTSMSDIAKAVGITKSSLYSHYTGKEKLFLAVYEDVASEHGKIFERLLDVLKNMEIEDKLRCHFTESILYFLERKEIYYFFHQSLFHLPPELGYKIRSRNLDWEIRYQKELGKYFAEGMRKGVIRKGSPEKRAWSFRINWGVALGWMVLLPELKVEIDEIWKDFWCGVAERNEDR